MAAPFYRFKVITPKGTAYQGDVTHALIPAEDGFVGVLANHAPYVTSSSGGKLALRDREGKETEFQIGHGFFEVAKNEAAFLVQSFQPLSPTP